MKNHSQAGKMSGIARRVAALPKNATKEEIMAAVVGVKQSLTIPKRVWKLVAQRLEKNEAAVVTRGRKGMIKVFSFQTYATLIASSSKRAIDAKLWEKVSLEQKL